MVGLAELSVLVAVSKTTENKHFRLAIGVAAIHAYAGKYARKDYVKRFSDARLNRPADKWKDESAALSLNLNTAPELDHKLEAIPELFGLKKLGEIEIWALEV